MTAFEKLETGMRLMAEGCTEAKSCSNCPYEKFCEKIMPSSWVNSTFEDDDEEVDYDWGYNEDMGYDPYEGCYTWDC